LRDRLVKGIADLNASAECLDERYSKSVAIGDKLSYHNHYEILYLLFISIRFIV